MQYFPSPHTHRVVVRARPSSGTDDREGHRAWIVSAPERRRVSAVHGDVLGTDPDRDARVVTSVTQRQPRAWANLVFGRSTIRGSTAARVMTTRRIARQSQIAPAASACRARRAAGVKAEARPWRVEATRRALTPGSTGPHCVSDGDGSTPSWRDSGHKLFRIYASVVPTCDKI